jgi:hypothetical protein
MVVCDYTLAWRSQVCSGKQARSGRGAEIGPGAGATSRCGGLTNQIGTGGRAEDRESDVALVETNEPSCVSKQDRDTEAI